MISDTGKNFVKSEGSDRNEFYINPTIEQLREFSATRTMKDFQKNLGPEDQQPILTESERLAAIKKEKDEFDNRKKIEIKGLPADIKAEDVASLLASYRVGPIQLERVDQYTNAAVLLGSGQEAEAAIREFNGSRYKPPNGPVLQCAMASVDSLLCITNLPLSYTQENVRKMCESYGPVDRCFVMPSEETGNSKGYAFVEYPNKDIARKAKTQLNGRLVQQTHEINCDWTDESHTNWNKLHSTCLLAELGADFNDSTKFRSLFNKIADPRYIQLALNSETRKCLGFGIVAFENATVTEQTWYKVNGANVYGQNVRVYFVCPGHSGRNEYTRRLGKCKKPPQAILGAPIYQGGHPSFPNGLMTMNPLIMAKLGQMAPGSNPAAAAAAAAHQSSAVGANSVHANWAVAGGHPGAAAGGHGTTTAAALAQYAAHNQALQIAAAHQAAAATAGAGNMGASAAHTNSQAAANYAALVAAAQSVQQQHQAGGGGAPAVVLPQNAAALHQQLQHLAAQSAGSQSPSVATAPHGVASQTQEAAAQAQMIALASAANSKDRIATLIAQQQQQHLGGPGSHQSSSTSSISQNTSAANSLLQHNASQLKALGYMPVTGSYAASGTGLDSLSGSGSGHADVVTSSATAANSNPLLAMLAASQQHQQQQQQQLVAAAAMPGLAAAASPGSAASLAYHQAAAFSPAAGFDLIQQAQQQILAAQQQQQILQQQQLFAAQFGGTAASAAAGGAVGVPVSSADISALLYGATTAGTPSYSSAAAAASQQHQLNAAAAAAAGYAPTQASPYISSPAALLDQSGAYDTSGAASIIEPSILKRPLDSASDWQQSEPIKAKQAKF